MKCRCTWRKWTTVFANSELVLEKGAGYDVSLEPVAGNLLIAEFTDGEDVASKRYASMLAFLNDWKPLRWDLTGDSEHPYIFTAKR